MQGGVGGRCISNYHRFMECLSHHTYYFKRFFDLLFVCQNLGAG